MKNSLWLCFQFLILYLVLPLAGCLSTSNEVSTKLPNRDVTHPFMYLTEDRRSTVMDVIQRAPMSAIYADLQDKALSDLFMIDGSDWDAKNHGKNGEIAASNAFLAWLNQNEEAALRALGAMETLTSDWDNHTGWGINIRMPSVLMHYTAAWDFLMATPYMSQEQAQAIEEKLTTITDQFFTYYVLDDVNRQLALTLTQNNHPIRTAAAIGFVALAFQEHPQSNTWLDWAVSELDYLLGPDGQYVQSDGVISEGPFYFNYGFAPAIAFYIALENRTSSERVYHRNCINRSDADPWTGHGCLEGEQFTMSNPLRSPLFHSMMDWSLALRLPGGHRAPIADSSLRSQLGNALFPHFGGAEYLYWDWATNTSDPYKVKGGFELAITHLAYVNPPSQANPPNWKNRFFIDGGMAVFRSGWTPEDRVLILMGEHGSARKTVHDHTDGTSFVMAAYGDLLLTDTGYYKPNPLNNPVTSAAGSHNLILVDGEGAPTKGLLNDWGDADAFIEHTLDGDNLAYAESRTRYQNTDVKRGLAFVRQRYFVVADQLESMDDVQREYRFRIHAYAGKDVEGTVQLDEYGPHIQKDNGSVVVYTAVSQGMASLEEPPFVALASPHVHKLVKDAAHHTVTDSVSTGVAPDFLSVLAPYKTGARDGPEAPLEVTSIATDRGAAWMITGENWTDIAWIREEGAPTELEVSDGVSITTDGRFIVVSLNASQGLLVRGTDLRVNGERVVSANEGEVVTSTP